MTILGNETILGIFTVLVLELLIEKRGGGAREGIVGKVPVAGSRYRTHIQ